MKIKDKEAEAMIRRSRVYQVAKRIDEYPETDVGSRSNLQIRSILCYNDYTGSPMYKPSAIQDAKDIRNKYIRTTRLMASLNQMGIRGRWQ